MKVTILLGSIRTGRQSHKVAHYLEKMLQKRGIATDLIDLAKDPLPMYGDLAEQALLFGHNIEKISQRIVQGDALLFVTPEYHGSFSGVLKNALDHYWAQFHKKPIGVVAVASGKKGGINASTQLQHVILSLGAFPLPLKLLVPEVHLAFDESSEPLRKDFVQYTHKFLDEFLWFARAIVKAKSIPEKSVA